MRNHPLLLSCKTGEERSVRMLSGAVPMAGPRQPLGVVMEHYWSPTTGRRWPARALVEDSSTPCSQPLL